MTKKTVAGIAGIAAVAPVRALNLVSEMIRILRRNYPDEIRETTAEALQSHLICFLASPARRLVRVRTARGK